MSAPLTLRRAGWTAWLGDTGWCYAQPLYQAVIDLLRPGFPGYVSARTAGELETQIDAWQARPVPQPEAGL